MLVNVIGALCVILMQKDLGAVVDYQCYGPCLGIVFGEIFKQLNTVNDECWVMRRLGSIEGCIANWLLDGLVKIVGQIFDRLKELRWSSLALQEE